MSKLPAWFLGYRSRAGALLLRPGAVETLLEQAYRLARRPGAMSTVTASLRADLETCIALVKAALAGRYQIPYSSLTLLIGTLLYFVVPTDLVPDLIPAAGLLDDAALITLVAARLSAELEDFRRWQRDGELQA